MYTSVTARDCIGITISVKKIIPFSVLVIQVQNLCVAEALIYTKQAEEKVTKKQLFRPS